MELNQEEFENQFQDTLDEIIENMAESAAVDVKKFYNMTCYLENLAFFGPVIYGLLQKAKE